MLFNSYNFLFFFPIVLLCFFSVPNKLKTFILLIASYIFYMGWNPRYALLILFITMVTYIAGLLLEKTEKRKLIVGVGIVCCCLILFIYKYMNFMLTNVNWLLTQLGVNNMNNTLDIT